MACVKIPREELKLVKKLDAGGFSMVYKALWKETEVAAKRSNQTDPQKDQKEVESLSRVNHRNIIKMLGVVDDGIDFFLILELCDGGSLRKYLNENRGKRLGIRFYDWAKQVARAIDYLKEKKITHKDVKSPNILIAKGSILKLADFGLAKDIDATITRATETASYPWMAPELLRDNVLSPSYDIHSYGVVGWELWTTDIPFEDAKEPANLVWRICQNNERPPIPDDCPKSIANLLTQCWNENWKERPSPQHILSVVS